MATTTTTTLPPGTFFERQDGHPEQIDQITTAVHLARGNTQGIYNAVSESHYTHNSSPADTEWSYSLIGPYSDWEAAVHENPPEMVGQYIYMHVISENRYFQLYFLSWTVGGGPARGGFSYIRNEVNITTTLPPDPFDFRAFATRKSHGQVITDGGPGSRSAGSGNTMSDYHSPWWLQ